jgi:hypothetical protein
MTEDEQDNAASVTPADAKELARRQFGEDIAFGLQQTVACWATDFIDPVVGEKIQHRMGDAAKMPTGSTWIGEFVGDTAAFFAFLGVQKFAPGITRGLHKISRKLFDGFLEKSAKGHLKHWAEEHDVAIGSPEYKKKMEEWKEFQADNMAKSSIISAASTGLNIGTQRAIGNKNKIWVIAVAKITGALITVAGMLGLRFALPQTTRSLDEELSQRYFSPIIRKTQELFGAEVSEIPQEHTQQHRERDAAHKAGSYVERIDATNANRLTKRYGR